MKIKLLFCLGMLANISFAELPKKIDQKDLKAVADNNLRYINAKKSELQKFDVTDLRERAKKKFEILVSTKQGGSDIGGGEGVNPTLSPRWCLNRKTELEIYHNKAARKVVKTGDYRQAGILLVEGMSEALKKNGNDHHGIMTFKALVRGLHLSEALEVGRPIDSREVHRQKYLVLKSYYDFILNLVTKLDLEVFIPYFTHRGPTLETLSQRMVIYAKDQLSWIQDNFTSTHLNNNHETETVPVGNANHYLLTMELFALELATDLMNDDLWKYRFACTVNKLLMLHDLISQHNSGEDGAFEGDDRIAVNEITVEIESIITTLGTVSCLN